MRSAPSGGDDRYIGRWRKGPRRRGPRACRYIEPAVRGQGSRRLRSSRRHRPGPSRARCPLSPGTAAAPGNRRQDSPASFRAAERGCGSWRRPRSPGTSPSRADRVRCGARAGDGQTGHVSSSRRSSAWL